VDGPQSQPADLDLGVVLEDGSSGAGAGCPTAAGGSSRWKLRDPADLKKEAEQTSFDWFAADVVYAANGIDGSTVTDITIDDDLLLVNVDVGTITWGEIYAYETVWLYGEEGIRDEGRIIEAVDTANYKLTDFLIKNITDPTEPLVISGGYGVDSVSGETIDIIDTTGGTVFTAPPHVVAYATGSALTAAQDAKLTAIDATVPKALTTSKFIALK
jgi:hypothetical protein